LGEAWTVEISPAQVFAYAEDGYARESTGSMLSEYVSSAISQLKYFVERNGDDVKSEINAIAHAHTITMDIDVDNKVSYNGVVVTPEGQLTILFGKGYLGTNIYDALEMAKLAKALNEAPSPADLPLSFAARRSIKTDYDAAIGSVQTKVNELLQKEVALDPNFDAVFAKLKAAPNAQDRWEQNLGSFVQLYFAALARALEYQKFGEDDMMREALQEVVESNKVVFRVVDDGKMKESYNESVIEDGVLYLQV
jgi:hypothetical protein